MKFKVSGICFVPTEASMEIEADSKKEAVEKAVDLFEKDRLKRQAAIDARSSDIGAAFEWEPDAEEI